ncbi:MAG TPA: hypothetical protein VJV05_17790 [Pyrinomonadaceae bacterium]|nr:hypothetical protein [Pyrinomonadaceae bacterium]
MLKKTKYFATLCAALMLCAIGSVAQSPSTSRDQEATKFASVIMRAVETSVFENGRLRSVKIRLPNSDEKLITLEYPTNEDLTFTLIEDARRTQVFLDKDRRISSIVFSDGKRAEYDWALAPSGYWLPKSITVGGRSLSKLNRSSLIGGLDCTEVCDAASHAASVAIATCLISGGSSVPCVTATVAAAAAAYRCYKCNYPEVEEPPTN